jgi:hypothetical protein
MAKCVAPEESGWTFCPNLPAAILFTVLYGLCIFIHLFLAVRTRKVINNTILLRLLSGTPC